MEEVWTHSCYFDKEGPPVGTGQLLTQAPGSSYPQVSSSIPGWSALTRGLVWFPMERGAKDLMEGGNLKVVVQQQHQQHRQKKNSISNVQTQGVYTTQ